MKHVSAPLILIVICAITIFDHFCNSDVIFFVLFLFNLFQPNDSFEKISNFFVVIASIVIFVSI